MFSMFMAELCCDQGAPIAALRAKLLIAEHVLHKFDPEVCGTSEVDAWGGHWRGKSKTWQGGDDDVKGVVGVTTEGGRIC